jgi:N-acetylglucosaminyl-diphospho-decaprenol L-rhamnosyltransferase
MTTLGVVMVTFRAGEAATRALSALRRAGEALDDGARLVAVVVDSASGDDTIDRIRRVAPWAELVALQQNVGFAAGCNNGIRRLANADVIILLNPDVELRSDFLARLVALEWPDTVAARGPAILDAHGRLEQSARGFPGVRTAFLGRASLLARARPGSRLLRRDLRADRDAGPQEVDWVSGACMIAPAARFRTIGLLDEGYFMYWEDADWCWRARQRGYRVMYEPSLVATHHQGSSSRYRAVATTIAFHRSAFRYWRTNAARSRASVAAAGAALATRCSMKLIGLAARRGIARARGGGRSA